MGRPAKPLVVSADDRVQLESMARSQSLPAALSRRAQMILRMADGEPQTAIAHRYGVSRPTVTLWRTRYRERGIAGLHNELKPGRPRTTSDEKVAELVNTVLTRKPKGHTHWSRRTLAVETGRSTTTVHRYMTLFGLQPHRSKRFKLSTDAFFIEKVRDIVGLYLNPPDHALVLCGREEPGTGLGAYPAGAADGVGVRRRHHARRRAPWHNALLPRWTSPTAASSPVQTLHRHQEFLSFLRHVDAQVPQDLDVHLICDNDATHKQVERWFGLITQRTIRRGSFDSVADLKRKINAFVEHYNQNPRPFKSTATADSILAKIERVCKVINGTPR